MREWAKAAGSGWGGLARESGPYRGFFAIGAASRECPQECPQGARVESSWGNALKTLALQARVWWFYGVSFSEFFIP